MKTLSAAEAFILMAKTEFREFDKNDWDCFCGCESANPLIGYNGEYTLILDGENLGVFSDTINFEGNVYRLTLLDP